MDTTPSHDRLAGLVAHQAGLVARRQLTAHGVGWETVDAQVHARRWQVLTPRVIATTTGSLSPAQRRWLAVLHAGPRSMLGSLSAAQVLGLRGWERETITVWVDDELAFEPVPGVRFFRSRRPFDLMRLTRHALPVARLEPSLLLWSGYDADERAAVGVLAASVQQRLTTAERLLEWVDLLRPLRRARLFRHALRDIAAGSHSAAERDVPAMCRAFALPLPHRQRRRNDATGRPRWTDCEWDLEDGSTVVLEVDGAFHMEVRAWAEDVRRVRRLTSRDRLVVGCTAYELRHEPAEVARDLVHLGVGGRLDPGDVA